MSLPNPDYLALAYYNWNGDQFDAALIDNSPGGSPAIATGRRDIRWDTLNSIDKQVVHDLIMFYAGRNSLTEANALTLGASKAYHVLDYKGQLAGGDSAGLSDDVIYKGVVVVNGSAQTIKFVGVASDTVTQVLAKINADITGATLAIDAGNLELSSDVAGAGQDVEVLDDGNIFRNLTGYHPSTFTEKRVGVDNIADVFDLNFRDGYQSYAELLIGSLRVVPDKPYKNPKTDQDIYFNHSTGVWTFLHSDVAV